MSESTKGLADSYACDGRNFTSRPADNYEEIFELLQIDTRAKNVLRAVDQRKNRSEILRLRLAPSPRDKGGTHESRFASKEKHVSLRSG
jgi:hypothetical protein